MSDRNRSHANARSDPDDLPAGELAAWWDRRTRQRRSGSTHPTSAPEPAAAVVAQLEALARADELSAPQPGFLNDLEKQLMDTQLTALPPAIASPRPEPLPTIRIARPPRRGRGLIDILTVAAVLALLLGGSWSVWNDRVDAPPPVGQNGLAGVSTPDDSGTPSLPHSDSIALDQPWATNQANDLIEGVAPVDTSECRTVDRGSGEVAELIRQETLSTGTTGNLLAELFPTLRYQAADDVSGLIQDYPAAAEDQRAIVDDLYSQVAACRFDNGKQTSGKPEPYTGAYWSLFGTDYFLDHLNLRLGNPVLDLDEVMSQSFGDEPAVAGQGAYPPEVLDVRTLPPTEEGSARLLVLRRSVTGFTYQAVDVLVFEDGFWRFARQQLVTDTRNESLASFPVDVGIGSGSDGMTTIQVVGAQVEDETPVAMTIFNRGNQPQEVAIGGQDLGTLESGASLRIRPFAVQASSVKIAGGRLDFTVTAQPIGAKPGDPRTASANFQVFPSGGLARRFGITPSTPTASAATPVGTPESGAWAGAVDRVVEIDQPWAVSTGTDVVGGEYPVPVSACTTAPRQSGALLSLVEITDGTSVAEFPGQALTVEIDTLFNQYVDGSNADLEAALRFFQQWSACRFETGADDLPLEDLYTGAFHALRSNDNLLRVIPEGEDRTAESLRRQARFDDSLRANGPYPDEVLDVRVYPADDRGHPRLLVRHRNVAGTPYDQVSLLVQEEGA